MSQRRCLPGKQGCAFLTPLDVSVQLHSAHSHNLRTEKESIWLLPFFLFFFFSTCTTWGEAEGKSRKSKKKKKPKTNLCFATNVWQHRDDCFSAVRWGRLTDWLLWQVRKWEKFYWKTSSFFVLTEVSVLTQMNHHPSAFHIQKHR